MSLRSAAATIMPIGPNRRRGHRGARPKPTVDASSAGRTLAISFTLDAADAIAVERHALRWLVAHDRPLIRLYIPLTSTIDSTTVPFSMSSGNGLAPYPVDGQPILVPRQVGGVLPGHLGGAAGTSIDPEEFRHAP